MLSPVIKNLVEMRLGYEIRYPSDCERLSYEIASSTTNQPIGVTTLKRMFGFVSGQTTPRLSTLDILAKYLGYRNYDELIKTLDPDRKSMQPGIRQLQASDLQKETRIRLFYEEKYLCLECEGEAEFRVVKSTDPKLWTDDRVTILSFHVDNPVFVRRLIRKGMETKDLVLAKVSGLERIKMEDQTGSATNTVRTSDTTGVG